MREDEGSYARVATIAWVWTILFAVIVGSALFDRHSKSNTTAKVDAPAALLASK
jgi:hypothetical protein